MALLSQAQTCRTILLVHTQRYLPKPGSGKQTGVTAHTPTAAPLPPRLARDPGVLPPADPLAPTSGDPSRTQPPPPPHTHAHMLITAPTPGRSLSPRANSVWSPSRASSQTQALCSPRQTAGSVAPGQWPPPPARGVALPRRDSQDEGSGRGRRESP